MKLDADEKGLLESDIGDRQPRVARGEQDNSSQENNTIERCGVYRTHRRTISKRSIEQPEWLV